jgi:hypothetical protein
MTYEEWMINICKNGILRDNVIDLLEFDDVCLLEDLHCKVLTSSLVPCQSHSTERA